MIVIGGINAVKEETLDIEAVQHLGETDLTEARVQIEENSSDQSSDLTGSNPAENSNPVGSNPVDRNLEDSIPADSNSLKNEPLKDNSAGNLPDKNENSIDENLTVSFLDVGQGDSILLEYNGKAMLIDAGEQDQESKVSAYIYEHEISSIDYVVATHPHSDHIGGMDEILSSFEVEHFVDSGFPYTSNTYENMLNAIDKKNIPFDIAKRGEEIEFDPAVDIEVLNPGEEYFEEVNENSIVLKVSYGEISFLLMGDAGLETEETLIDSGYDIDSEILKVGHHASRSGSGEEFISLASPEISIIEVGAGNDYGHPHKGVLERLQKISSIYRTDLDGTITVSTDGSTYTVTTEKNGSGKENGAIPGGDYSSTNSAIVKESGSTQESEPDEESEPKERAASNTSIVSTTSSVDSEEPTIYVTDLNLQDEWVKIMNKGSSPVSLKGWKIDDEGSKHTYIFPTCTLESQTTVTLYTGKGTSTGTAIYWGSGSPIWNNDGDTAYLYDNKGKLVSELER